MPVLRLGGTNLYNLYVRSRVSFSFGQQDIGGMSGKEYRIAFVEAEYVYGGRPEKNTRDVR